MLASATRKAIQPLHILVVEDNRVNQRVLELQLQKWGLRPQFANDGIEALEALERKDYDLVLMDCQMPRMDGYEATRRLRASSRNQKVQVVAITANALDGDRERCFSVGMNAFLPKPVKTRDLQRILEDVADRPGGLC